MEKIEVEFGNTIPHDIIIDTVENYCKEVGYPVIVSLSDQKEDYNIFQIESSFVMGFYHAGQAMLCLALAKTE